MNWNRTVLGWLATACLGATILTACDSSDDSSGTGGGGSGAMGGSGGGTGGTGGSAAGGAAGTGGSAGDGGAAGTGGSAGDGGAAGTGGSAGDGGAAGTGGSAGDGGAAGTGGGAPSAACETYCSTIMTNCTGANAQYSGQDQCLGSCAAFPPSTDPSGNTVGCRTAHAQNAENDATVHCPHAGPSGDGVCGAACDGYCQIAMMYCTAANGAQIYTDLADCQADCQAHGATPRYTANVMQGNSVACLLYHAQEASVAPADHCNQDLAKTSTTCK